MKFLIVDDEYVCRTKLEAILRESLGKDCDVKIAETGEKALEITRDFRPDLILLDVEMPGIDGYETCRRIREYPTLRHTKIIMVSTKIMISERLKGYEVGADDYVTKPFNSDELLAKVSVYLRLKSVEEVDQLKSDMLALLCHETRTPLTTVLMPAEVLMSDQKMSNDQRKNFARMIHSSAKRLHRFFEKVIMLSAMKSGRWNFKLGPANLCDIVRDAICEAERASKQNVKIEAELDDTPIMLFDAAETKMAVAAMLDNAIRFSPPDESVTVRVSGDNGHICLSVTDHGGGIDSDSLPYVFTGFADANFKHHHHTEGHGLSLAIAQQIVLAHHGTISVKSTKGTETTFTVRLPITSSPEATPHQI